MAKTLFPAALAGVAAAGAAIGLGVPTHAPTSHLTKTAKQGERTVTFGLCHTGGGENCVVDGDTIWLDGVKIRIADIDTPETHNARCAAEQALGDRATARLHTMLNDGAFTIVSIGGRDEDRYGRKLRNVMRGGRSIGDQLVSEGLARRWTGRREPWC